MIAGDPSAGDILWAAVFGLLGLSFFVGGIAGNPGCELSALPNLALPPGKRIHFV